MPQCTIPAIISPTPLPCAALVRPGPLRSGNPRGNPNLAPRCGARTRAGCPCRAPALRGRQRCRMHGGGSTGPCTAEGLARIRAARTIHGGYGAEERAHFRYLASDIRRGRVLVAAALWHDRLPPDLAARLNHMPPELMPLPFPSGAQLLLSRAAAREETRQEAEALAPWKQAIAAARAAGRRHARRSPQPAGTALKRAPQPEAHAPWQCAVRRPEPAGRNPSGRMAQAAEGHAPWELAPLSGQAAPSPPTGDPPARPSTTSPPTQPPPGVPQQKAHAPWEAARKPAPKPPEGRLRRQLLGGTELGTWSDNLAAVGGWLTLSEAVARATAGDRMHPARGP